MFFHPLESEPWRGLQQVEQDHGNGTWRCRFPSLATGCERHLTGRMTPARNPTTDKRGGLRDPSLAPTLRAVKLTPSVAL